jgi:hypothetical protein
MWKDIEGYEGLYQVSKFGEIMSFYFGKKIILHPGFNGRYFQITLRKNKKGKMFLISRLVAIHFIPNPFNLSEVNHKNFIKIDDYVENLEWCTHKQNMEHAELNKLLNHSKGEKHGMHKLTKVQILEIRLKYIPHKYGSTKLSKEYNMARSTILDIVNNKIWIID